jgi:hypothetical protein
MHGNVTKDAVNSPTVDGQNGQMDFGVWNLKFLYWRNDNKAEEKFFLKWGTRLQEEPGIEQRSRELS